MYIDTIYLNGIIQSYRLCLFMIKKEEWMLIDLERYQLKCLRCGWRWFPKKADVRQCPGCQSTLWDTPKDGAPTPKKADVKPKPEAKAKPTPKPTIKKPDEISEDLWEAFKVLRQRKKAPITQPAIDLLTREAKKAGISLEEAMGMCVAQGWQGFQARYVQGNSGSQATKPSLLWNGIDKQDFGERRKI